MFVGFLPMCVICREAVVVSVKRFGGFVSINADGSWVCVGGSKHKEERHPDPVSNGLFIVIFI